MLAATAANIASRSSRTHTINALLSKPAELRPAESATGGGCTARGKYGGSDRRADHSGRALAKPCRHFGAGDEFDVHLRHVAVTHGRCLRRRR
jgi:hypothetical protein